MERTYILFVCHGNICRSPMAEFVMKDRHHLWASVPLPLSMLHAWDYLLAGVPVFCLASPAVPPSVS